MVKLKRLAVIPARGGSKRIKRKNIIEFHGKPLLFWTIDAALKSELFDDVIVSTEDEEIAAIACDSGATVPFRREFNTDDYSPISSVTAGVIDRLKLEFNKEYEDVVQLMANCPLRGPENIRHAVDYFNTMNAPSQISCFRYGWMNPWWAVTLNGNAEPSRVFPESFEQRSQDLPSLFCPSGAIWIAKSAILQKTRSFYSPGHIFCELPWKAAIDIDDEEDLEMARELFLPDVEA